MPLQFQQDIEHYILDDVTFIAMAQNKQWHTFKRQFYCETRAAKSSCVNDSDDVCTVEGPAEHGGAEEQFQCVPVCGQSASVHFRRAWHILLDIPLASC